ncbi:MAG: hypothetical protein ACI8TQ_002053, partial [Planctomycetota bacterium]
FTLPRQLPTPPFKSFFPLSRSKRIAPPTQPAVLLARTNFPRADAFASALHPTILPFLARQASTKGAGDPKKEQLVSRSFDLLWRMTLLATDA